MTRLSPAETLSQNVVLDTVEVAWVLRLLFRRGKRAGEPDRTRVYALVDAGVLRPVDPSLPAQSWTFSSAAVARYVKEREHHTPRPTPLRLIDGEVLVPEVAS